MRRYQRISTSESCFFGQRLIAPMQTSKSCKQTFNDFKRHLNSWLKTGRNKTTTFLWFPEKLQAKLLEYSRQRNKSKTLPTLRATGDFEAASR